MPKILVLDASAAVDFLLVRPFDAEIVEWMRDDSVAIHAPDLIWVEVASVLRRLCRSGDCSDHRALEALADLGDLGLVTHSLADLAPSALILRDHVSAYDAMYVSLAQALPATLITSDQRLARAIEATCDVRVNNPSP